MLLIGPLKLRNTSKFAFGDFMWFHVVSFSFSAHQPQTAFSIRAALPLGPFIFHAQAQHARTASHNPSHAHSTVHAPRAGTLGSSAHRAATDGSMQAEAGDDGAGSRMCSRFVAQAQMSLEPRMLRGDRFIDGRGAMRTTQGSIIQKNVIGDA